MYICTPPPTHTQIMSDALSRKGGRGCSREESDCGCVGNEVRLCCEQSNVKTRRPPGDLLPCPCASCPGILPPGLQPLRP